MTKKYKLLTTLPAAATSFVAVTQSASAHFGSKILPTKINQIRAPVEISKLSQDRYQAEAHLLRPPKETGINTWTESKTLKDIIEENESGVNSIKVKIQAKTDTRLQERLSTTAWEGIITQKQADKRLEWINNIPKLKHMKGGGAYRI